LGFGTILTVPMRVVELPNVPSLLARRSRSGESSRGEPARNRLTTSKSERLAALDGEIEMVASTTARFLRASSERFLGFETAARERFLGLRTTSGRPALRRRRFIGDDEGMSERRALGFETTTLLRLLTTVERLTLGLATTGARPRARRSRTWGDERLLFGLATGATTTTSPMGPGRARFMPATSALRRPWKTSLSDRRRRRRSRGRVGPTWGDARRKSASNGAAAGAERIVGRAAVELTRARRTTRRARGRRVEDRLVVVEGVAKSMSACSWCGRGG